MEAVVARTKELRGGQSHRAVLTNTRTASDVDRWLIFAPRREPTSSETSTPCAGALRSSRGRWRSKQERNLGHSLTESRRIGCALGLSGSVRNQACPLFRTAQNQTPPRGPVDRSGGRGERRRRLSVQQTLLAHYGTPATNGASATGAVHPATGVRTRLYRRRRRPYGTSDQSQRCSRRRRKRLHSISSGANSACVRFTTSIATTSAGVDRHKNTQSPEVHFQPPPDATATAAEPSCIDVTEVSLVVLGVVGPWRETRRSQGCSTSRVSVPPLSLGADRNRSGIDVPRSHRSGDRITFDRQPVRPPRGAFGVPA